MRDVENVANKLARAFIHMDRASYRALEPMGRARAAARLARVDNKTIAVCTVMMERLLEQGG